MSTKKWIAVSAVVGSIATISAFAFTNPVRIFRTVTIFLGVSQGQSLTSEPQYEYTIFDGSNLVAEALGTNPTSNQVFAMSVDCGSSTASFLAFDKSTSNYVTIATCDNLQTVKNQGLRSKSVNSERFVGQFSVQPVGNIAGGTLMVARRLHLGTNGCPDTVLIALDKDPGDKAFGDSDVVDTDQDAGIKDIYRAGEAHMVGSLSLISGSTTNLVLVPLGHISFRHQLDQFDVP